MAVQRVENVALPQVPNFEGRVVATGKKVASVGVEIDFINFCAMCVVMLDQSLASDVPDFDGFIV